MSGYVVYGCERLRDGLEEWARCFSTLEAALAYIDKDHFAKCNMEFRLFELGKEIPLESYEETEPQPAKTTTRFRVKNTAAVRKQR